jgi:DNA adenine methylase
MAKTILKWAGGKRWLVDLLAPTIKKYEDFQFVELFAGGAALSFALELKNVLLNDKNVHLINFYRQIQKDVDIFSVGIDFKNDKEVFYENRKKFNELIANNEESSPTAAALFYYLNKTAYNGLMRFNSKGFFNTPFGRYKSINYKFDIARYARLLKNWMLTSVDFEKVKIPKKAFVYADPPYDVEFTHYNAHGFGWEEQLRLAKYLSTLSNPLIISNQATERIIDLYSSLGFSLIFQEAPRSISCKKNREKAKEVIAYKNISLKLKI